MKTIRLAIAVALVIPSGAAVATNKPRTFVVTNEAFGVPVFPYDITDRPYTVLGKIRVGVRRSFYFSDDEISQEKIYKELWERADKMGADAVVEAWYGDQEATFGAQWGRVNATGIAIKFKPVDPPATK